MVDVIALPPLPGVPDLHLADSATLPADAAVALTADALDVLSALGAPAWGIDQGGVPVNRGEDTTFEDDLAEDVLEIVTVFSARLYGSRSRKNQEPPDDVKRAAEAAGAC